VLCLEKTAIKNMSYTDAELHDNLQLIFGYSGFREGQLEIIRDILAGDDCLILMPTGGGKSICFQLPALITNGVTVVISPLISLIKDQVDCLNAAGITAYGLTGDTPQSVKQAMWRDVKSSICQLIYTTPENMGNFNTIQTLRDLDRDGMLNFFVIDEAHCVSNWGHDFRPAYLALDQIRANFPNTPINAFTATATPIVQMDIVKQLCLTNVKIHKTSFVRPNIVYKISERTKRSCDAAIEHVYPLVRRGGIHYGQSGIVYCLSRGECEENAIKLRAYGVSADFYHASASPEHKEKVQNGWISGEIKVVVATIAFALGINKHDVRFVIHLTIPKSIEAYYQETGRAGRDGAQSNVYLFYRDSDVAKLKGMQQSSMIDLNNQLLEDGEIPAGHTQMATIGMYRLDDMLELCKDSRGCIKKYISNYLGEYIETDCGACTGCLRKYRDREVNLVRFNRFMEERGKLFFGEAIKFLMEEEKCSGSDAKQVIYSLLCKREIWFMVEWAKDHFDQIIYETGKKSDSVTIKARI
jgi:ATP-dependent DNA helicase RecQ